MKIISKTSDIALMTLIASVGVFMNCSTPPEFDENEWYNKTRAADSSLLYAPHVNEDGTFFNPWLSREQIKRRPYFLSRISDRKKKYEFPEENYTWKDNDYSYLADKNFDSISYYGHATLIVKMDGETIITDPFFSNAALVVRKKVRIKFDVSKVPQKPVILISHNHYDHLDKSSVKKLIKKNATFIVPLGLKKFFTRMGMQEVHELDWWGNVQLGGITYTLVPAQHWSRRIGQPGGKTLWGGYIMQGSRTVYFSGDTGYFCGFKEFGGRYAIDYALLGVGAYEPRWFMHYSHMNVHEFFAAAEETGAQLVIPMHFGVISLSEEPITYPLYEIDEYIKQNPEIAPHIRSLRVGEYIGMSGTE
jgi:L-ascorbate metabolism protein UlaG (beta-lactamase superfamily)